MKIQFITNVGTRDATAHGLDHTKCLADTVHEFPDEKAKELIAAVPPLAREYTKELAEADIAARELRDRELLRGRAPAPDLTLPPTPATFSQHPHSADPKAKK